MGNFSENIKVMGGILKSVSGLAVWVFIIWTLYFSGHYELTLLRGIIVFIFSSMFIGFVFGIPFGATFAPILFEWWLLDVPFDSISTFAWLVTGISLVANLLIVIGFASDR